MAAALPLDALLHWQRLTNAFIGGAFAWVQSAIDLPAALGLWDKTPTLGVRAGGHCERSEAILAQLFRHLRDRFVVCDSSQ